jgi:hypothetical protein
MPGEGQGNNQLRTSGGSFHSLPIQSKCEVSWRYTLSGVDKRQPSDSSKVSGPHSIKPSKSSFVMTCSTALVGDLDLDRLRPRVGCRGLPKSSGNGFGGYLARSTGKPQAHAMMSALVFQVFELLFGYTQSISHVGAMCDNCGKVWPPLTSPQGSAAIELSYGCYLVKKQEEEEGEYA